MSSKIIQAINAMAEKSQYITDVTKADNGEYYFKFKEYRWSIFYDTDTGNYYIHYYPGSGDIKSVMSIYPDSGIVSYSNSDFKTQEAYESFRDLHQVVQGKVFGIDGVLDDIINDLPF